MTTSVQNSSYQLAERGTFDAMVIHSSTPAFQPAFHRFISHHLNFSSVIPVVLPGGVTFFLSCDSPKLVTLFVQDLRGLIKESDVSRVVLLLEPIKETSIPFVLRALLPSGPTFSSRLLAFLRERLCGELGVSVEAYLAQPEDGIVSFYRSAS